jgi:Nucleotidyl transferase of unknown function (DUF2204)
VQEIEGDQPHVGKVPTITENASTTEISVPEEDSELRAALKYAAAALKADGVPFALGGGYALWVRGAPEPVHDVDLVVAEQDVPAAVNSLAEAGFRIERPPEDWLFKAWWQDSLVDVLHKLRGITVDRDLIDSADEVEVLGVRIPVLPPTPIMIAKLHSLSEHYGDFGAMLPTFRAVREQLDWPHIRAEVSGHPFAEAFLFLLERLEILDPAT